MKASGRTLDTGELARELELPDGLPAYSIYVRFPDGTESPVSRVTIETTALIFEADAESDDSILDRALSLLETIADGKSRHAKAARTFLDEADS